FDLQALPPLAPPKDHPVPSRVSRLAAPLALRSIGVTHPWHHRRIPPSPAHPGDASFETTPLQSQRTPSSSAFGSVFLDLVSSEAELYQNPSVLIVDANKPRRKENPFDVNA
ncbi:hypothetical protein Dimus_029015, partial [Dionaea muscipula]